jgi:hypothetical protein
LPEVCPGARLREEVDRPQASAFVPVNTLCRNKPSRAATRVRRYGVGPLTLLLALLAGTAWADEPLADWRLSDVGGAEEPLVVERLVVEEEVFAPYPARKASRPRGDRRRTDGRWTARDWRAAGGGLPALLHPDTSGYVWSVLPRGLVYRNYLAGAKEPRIRGVYSNGKDHGNLWDVSLGGKVSLVRYGTAGHQRPEGLELQLEGAGLIRLDADENMDVDSADYRIGAPLVWGNRYYQMKFGYYHLSSHLQDEFLLKHPGFDRLNYSRNVLLWGHSIYPTPELRFYFEAGWSFDTDVSKPWEFQFGVEYSPYYATGFRGAPFFAFNGHLREEVAFGGNFVGQVGWAWRGSPTSGLFRVGLDYYNGKSDQYSFYDYYESKLGVGIWYDY